MALGTDSNFGVPVTMAFSFNGTAVNWGTTRLDSMAPLSNSAESIDGNYRISDLDIRLIDTDGSVWTALGHGTTAFNKAFSATAWVGNGSNSFPIHDGFVSYVSRSNRIVNIKSKNNLRLVGDLEWKFPYKDEVLVPNAVLGSYFFYNDINLGTVYTNSVNEKNQDANSFKFYGAVATSAIGSLASSYPSIAGRGTLGLLTGYHYPGTQFYFDQPRFKFDGTFLGTKTGTINTEEEAQRFGFNSLGIAESAKLTDAAIAGPGKHYYPINKTRLHVNNGTNPTGSRLFLQQNLSLAESPSYLFRELLTGHCVSPYFGTSDLDASALAAAQLKTAFNIFVYKVDPKGGKVIPAIKNFMESIYGQFSVNPSNKFVFVPYGPRKLRQTLPSIGSSEVVESSYENLVEDYFNRVVLKYGYDHDSSSFTRTIELKADGWTTPLDRPYVIESEFLVDENQALVFAHRLLKRFTYTVPRIGLTVSLKHSGAELGSLYSVQDPDSFTGTKIIEVVGYQKDFSDGKNVQLSGIDAEPLYFRRGYAYWGTKVTLPGDAVNANSDSGWGTGGTVGTCPGINYDIHGTTSFIWW
jgi:hypothetical protein